MINSAFKTLTLRPELLAAIEFLGYTEMTAIQQQSLPHLLCGKDVLAQAKTGSGKTAAFAISILNTLEAKSYQTQALIVCPTRELADQVSKEIRGLARAIPNIKILTLCGGKPMGPQLASLEREPHIVVGTPGRLLKHLEKETLNLQKISTLVLDEADRMLDMGFSEDIATIIDATPAQRQTLLFSATYPASIKDISRHIQKEPIDIRIESSHQNTLVEQVFYETNSSGRNRAIITVLEHYQPESTLVFCNTRQQCQELANSLKQKDLHALALHGDMKQNERDQVIIQFSSKSLSILVATDVAARGLDIKELAAVINFELSRDPEVHIHRIGRTGRANSRGLAVSLFSSTEKSRLKAIEEYQSQAANIQTLSSLQTAKNFSHYPPMVCLLVNGGRKDKLRPGDLLGALTSGNELSGSQIGKITITDKVSYVAVVQKAGKQALRILEEGKIKGRKFKTKQLR